jgi:hypothetical protein
MGDWLNANIGQFLVWLWQWIQALAFWVTCAGGIVSLDLYVVSKDKKYLKFIGETFVIYFFIKMMGAQS